MRIAVVSVSRMLGDILEAAIREWGDAELVARTPAGQDPRFVLAGLDPDVVVIGGGRSLQEGVVDWLRQRHPDACVVVLSADGRRAVIHSRAAIAPTLYGVSAFELLETLRHMVRS